MYLKAHVHWQCFLATTSATGTNYLLALATLCDETQIGSVRGKYHYTIDPLCDWFGLVCFENKNKNCQLSYC